MFFFSPEISLNFDLLTVAFLVGNVRERPGSPNKGKEVD